MAPLLGTIQALNSSLLTPPTSYKDLTAVSGSCAEPSKVRTGEDAVLWRKHHVSTSSQCLRIEGQRHYQHPTETVQLRCVAGTDTSLAIPVGRPPFSLYKVRPLESTASRLQSNSPPVSRNQKLNCSPSDFPKRSGKRIKQTNPGSIARLWQDVMASKPPPYSRPTQASRARESDRSTISGQDLTTSSATPPTKRSSLRNATVRDVDFEDTQLRPRGIEIHRRGNIELGAIAGAHVYFGSETPSDPDESREFYRRIVQESLAGRNERDINDSIFLSLGPTFVQSVHTAYRSLGEAGLPEPEFKAYAFQNLFIGNYALLANDCKRQLCAVRSVEWTLKPRETDRHAWHTPPLLSPGQASSRPFDFDIYPDCQFWLCDKILNADYRENINLIVHCKALGTFCPYFSIEFKATMDDNRVVVNQIAAAGSISLYNRYQLKVDAHRQPVPDELELLRHYGLTMEKENWTVWRFEPNVTAVTWAGCNVRNLDSGTCKSEQGVRRLLSWINEIHRWGLCEYALECEDDIKHILSRDPSRIRVSAIGS